MHVSPTVAAITEPATLLMARRSRELRAQGRDIIDLSLGEPDHDPPAFALEAAHEALRGPWHKYPPVNGYPDVRQAIADKFKRDNGLEYTADQIVVSTGAKQALMNVVMSMVGPGDEVVIPAPYWVSYSDLVIMTGANAVLVNTTPESKFKMTVEQLKAAITPNTRIVMLNSPNNPTGTVYSREELAALAECFFANCDGAILSDEIYENLTYGNAKPTCIATLKPEYRDRVITVSGASKSYAMTGWRMGWTVAPANVIKAMDNIQSQETSCPSSVSQYALMATLDSPETPVCVAAMLKEFAERKALTCHLLNAIPGLKLVEPEGAFYAFFDVSSYYGKTFNDVKVTDSLSFCSALLEQGHVNLIAGSAFGTDNFARMSFACNIENIRTGLDKLAKWLATGV